MKILTAMLCCAVAFATAAKEIEILHDAEGVLAEQPPPVNPGDVLHIALPHKKRVDIFRCAEDGTLKEKLEVAEEDATKHVYGARMRVPDENQLDVGGFVHYAIIEELEGAPPDLAKPLNDVSGLFDRLKRLPKDAPFVQMTFPTPPGVGSDKKSTEALQDFAKKVHLTLDEEAAQLESARVVAQGTPELAHQIAVLAEVRVELADAVQRLEKATAAASKQACDTARCKYRLVFAGELPVGANRRALAVDLDGRLLGNATLDRLGPYRESDTIFIYVVHEGPDLAFSAASVATPTSATVIHTQPTLSATSTRPAADTPEDIDAKTDKDDGKHMQRVNQGDLFPGDNLIALTLTQRADATDNSAKDRPLAPFTLRVYKSYHLSVNAGVVYTTIERNTIQLPTGATEPLVHSSPRVLPVLFLTYFWHAREYADPFRLRLCDRFLFNPSIGFRIDSPGSDLFFGGTVEPIRGVLVSGGYTLGEQAVSDGTSTQAGPNIYNVWKRGGYIGVSFDLNLFGGQLLQLVGF